MTPLFRVINGQKVFLYCIRNAINLKKNGMIIDNETLLCKTTNYVLLSL